MTEINNGIENKRESKESGRHSIKISRTSRGKYSWEIKIYFDEYMEEKDLVLKRIQEMDNDLRQKFKTDDFVELDLKTK